MPPHLATLLTATNIRTYNKLNGSDWWSRYLRLRRCAKAELLAEVLAAVGYSERTVDVIRRIDRSRFCDERMADVAWLNWTLPLRKGSGLSAPGIVAHYLDVALQYARPQTVTEIGLGSGYHAALVSSLFPTAEVIGYEPIGVVAHTARRTLKELCIPVEVRNAAFAFEGDDLGVRDYIYVTTAASRNHGRALAENLSEEGLATFVRPLSAREYAARPRDQWLVGLYPSFDCYRLTDGWSTSCAVASIRSPAGAAGALEEVDVLYGVTFVPWAHSSTHDPGPGRSAQLEQLSSAQTTEGTWNA